MQRWWIGVTVGVATLLACSSRPGTSDDLDLSRPIEQDLELRHDRLENGLRFYVREHGRSDENTQLRLIVQAGSVLEDEDQRGLAHGVEHMAIRETRRFPHQAISNYFAALGMRRGEGINGTTTADHTEYRMSLPSDNPPALDTALAMLAAIAQDARFTAEEARVESGIIFEEWRSGRDAWRRRGEAELDLLLKGSVYASRLPIGDTTVVRRFDVEALERFYRTWYRPDLMAVVAVGGFDADTVEALVRKHFGGLTVRAGAKPHPRPEPPPRSRPLRTAVIVDEEATTSRVVLSYPVPVARYLLRRDLRAVFVRGLWRDILEARLEEASREAGSPILSVSVAPENPVKGLRTEVVSATVTSGSTRDALRRIASIVHQLARDGLTRDELDESARGVVNRSRNAYTAGDVTDDLVAEYAEEFLDGSAPMTRGVWYRAARDLLPTITPDDVRAFGRTFSLDSGAVLTISSAPDDPIARESPSALAADVRSSSERFTPLPHREPFAGFLAKAPRPGRVVDEKKVPEIGAFDWHLSNGVRVLLKPTSFRYNEIILRATLPGGISQVGAADDLSAWLSDALVSSMGVGVVNDVALGRWFRQSSVSLSPTVTDEAISFSGGSNSDDLARLLELMHAYVVAPREDTVAFRRYHDRMVELRRGRERNPDEVLSDTLSLLMDGTDRRARRSSAAALRELNLATALRFWSERMANASGLTVALVGDFSLDAVRPLVEQYLASLPAGRPELAKDMGYRFPPGGAERVLSAGTSGRSRTIVAMSGDYGSTTETAIALSVVRDLVDLAVSDRLRETLGSTYGVSSSTQVDLNPPARYILTVDFEGDPARMPALTREVDAVLRRLVQDGPTERELQSLRATGLQDYRDGSSVDNAFWASELSSHARLGWPFATISAHERDRATLTRDAVRQMCATLLRTQGVVRVTMRPRAGSS